jgi:hypothetical protein
VLEFGPLHLFEWQELDYGLPSDLVRRGIFSRGNPVFPNRSLLVPVAKCGDLSGRHGSTIVADPLHALGDANPNFVCSSNLPRWERNVVAAASSDDLDVDRRVVPAPPLLVFFPPPCCPCSRSPSRTESPALISLISLDSCGAS